MTDSTLMFTSQARVGTAKAKTYLSQVCKHFAHKAPTTFDERHGRIEFSSGDCDLLVEGDDMLVLAASAVDRAGLASVEDIVERHLRRFAFREELGVRWVRRV